MEVDVKDTSEHYKIYVLSLKKKKKKIITYISLTINFKENLIFCKNVFSTISSKETNSLKRYL